MCSNGIQTHLSARGCFADTRVATNVSSFPQRIQGAHHHTLKRDGSRCRCCLRVTYVLIKVGVLAMGNHRLLSDLSVPANSYFFDDLLIKHGFKSFSIRTRSRKILSPPQRPVRPYTDVQSSTVKPAWRSTVPRAGVGSCYCSFRYVCCLGLQMKFDTIVIVGIQSHFSLLSWHSMTHFHFKVSSIDRRYWHCHTFTLPLVVSEGELAGAIFIKLRRTHTTVHTPTHHHISHVPWPLYVQLSKQGCYARALLSAETAPVCGLRAPCVGPSPWTGSALGPAVPLGRLTRAQRPQGPSWDGP